MTRALLLALLLALGCGNGGAPAAPAPTQITIELRRDGASPAAVEAELIIPIEDALAAVPGIAHLNALAEQDVARLWIDVAPGADPAAVRSAVRERLGPLQSTLPTDATIPVVTVVPPNLSRRHFHFVVDPKYSPPFTTGQLYSRHRNSLEAKPGIRRVEPCGAADETLGVRLDPARLAATGLSIESVITAIEAGTWGDVPAGSLAGPSSPHGHLASIQVTPQIRLSDLAVIERTETRKCHLVTNLPALAIVEAVTAEPGTEIHLGDDRVELGTGRVIEGWFELPGSPDSMVALLTRVRDRWIASAPVFQTVAFQVPATDAARGFATTRVRVLLALLPEVARADVALIAAELDDQATAIPGMPSMRLQADGIVELEVVLTGPDLAALTETARRLAEDVLANRHIAHAGCDPCPPAASVVVELDHARLAELGIPAAQVERALAVTGPGLVLGTLQYRSERLPIRLAHDGPADLVGATGARVPLSAVSQLRPDATPSRIRRHDRQRAIVVWVRATHGTGLPQLRATVASRSQRLELPPGVQLAPPTPPSRDPW